MKHIAITISLALAASAVAAKLPPVSAQAKANATETSARSAWSDKVAQYRLCQAQDRIAANYRRQAGKEPGAPGTPGLAACTDPGPFSYTPPTDKPLEAAGAHSPPGTAVSPPNTKLPAAETKTSDRP